MELGAELIVVDEEDESKLKCHVEGSKAIIRHIIIWMSFSHYSEKLCDHSPSSVFEYFLCTFTRHNAEVAKN